MKRKSIKPKTPKFKEWKRIPWDGNPDLGFECWRKSFRKGHVSVGIGPDFLSIVFSYGANSDDSFSSTRWLGESVNPMTEAEAMARIDAKDGRGRCL